MNENERKRAMPEPLVYTVEEAATGEAAVAAYQAAQDRGTPFAGVLPITATRRFLNTQPARTGTGPRPPDAHFFPCRAFSAASASCWR